MPLNLFDAKESSRALLEKVLKFRFNFETGHFCLIKELLFNTCLLINFNLQKKEQNLSFNQFSLEL